MTADEQAPAGLAICSACGRPVPDGAFCGACGAHLGAGDDGAADRYRYHAFAANPAEHVLQPSVISTLFPHLPHRRTAPFQMAALLAGLFLLALGALRFTGPAIAAAALLVPLLYLLYLYEVEVYEDEPVTVLAATVGVGALLGVGWALVSGPLITRSAVQNLTVGATPNRILIAGVLLPLAAQLVMLVGTLIVYTIRHFDEALDGFSFGAASALGFTAALTVVNLWPELRTSNVAQIPALTSVTDVLQRGLLVPFINAGTTGLIAGALWLRRGEVRRLGGVGRAWVTSLPGAVVVAVVVDIVLGLSDTLADNLAGALVVRLIVAAALLLAIRLAVHHMLLAEAVTTMVGAVEPCAHCHHIVPRMAFCPNCGVAIRATPKTGRGRTARAVR